jgi:hypothetical protein
MKIAYVVNFVVLEGMIIAKPPQSRMRSIVDVVMFDGNAHAINFKRGVVSLGPAGKFSDNIATSNNI